jgi:hypothetical protein
MFSTACHSATITTIVLKWWVFSYIFDRRERERKVGWVEDDSQTVLGKTFHGGKKGSVRRFVVMMQQPVLISPKFGAKSSQIFTQSP